jgi:hypothetical protein
VPHRLDLVAVRVGAPQGRAVRQRGTVPVRLSGRRANVTAMRTRGRRILLGIAAVVVWTLVARGLGYRLGANTVVRCRRGHLFTTIWIPGVKLKAIDLLVARVQWCPVGRHWSLVTPVRDAHLSVQDRVFAASHHDVRIP